MSAQKGLRGSLAALGTAAVLAIYSAGYSLTEEAAQSLEEPYGILPAPPLPPGVEVQVAMQDPAEDSVEPALTPEPPPAPASAPDLTPVQPPVGTAQAQPVPETAAATSPVAAPAAAPAPATPVPETAPSPDTVAAEAPAASPYRDGVFTARGMRTRHGTIEARVEISDGRIVSATVASCGMRWPCSDIDRIIPRVAQRQSTAIGIVSGATQSSEAFITAVDAALLQAMTATP